MSATSPLFDTYKLRGLTLPNRVVMAPMTRSFSPGGVPGENVAEYYARRGDADVGLIIRMVECRQCCASDPWQNRAAALARRNDA